MSEAWTIWLSSLVAASLWFFSSYAFLLALRKREALARTRLRYRFFAVRDELYVSAAMGLIPADSLAFTRLRGLLNGCLSKEGKVGVGFYLILSDRGDGNHDDATVRAVVDEVHGFGVEASKRYINMTDSTLHCARDLMLLNSRFARLLARGEAVRAGREVLKQYEAVSRAIAESSTVRSRDLSSVRS